MIHIFISVKNVKSEGWGLALSGGGARGVIHIGVLQAFDDAGIRPVCISGTSMGAIVGAFYAAGVRPGEMLALLKKRSWLRMFGIKASFAGFLEMTYLRSILEKHVPDDFDKLEIPFFAGATNLSNQSFEIFSTGSVWQAVVASASIPILFTPVKIGSSRYVDGGVINNVPSDALKGKCDFILGVDVNNVQFRNQPDNIKAIAIEVFNIVVQNNSKSGLDKCDALINPHLGSEFDMLDFSKTDALYERGYTEGKAWIAAGMPRIDKHTEDRIVEGQ